MGTLLSSKDDIYKNTSGIYRATKRPVQTDDIQHDPQYPEPVIETQELNYSKLQSRKQQGSWIQYILKYWLPGVCVGVIFIVFARIAGVYAYVGIMNTIIIPIAERDTVPYIDIPVEKGSTERVIAIMDGTNYLNLLLTHNGDTAHAKIILGPQVFNMYNPQKARLHLRISAKSPNRITIIVTAEGPLQTNGLDIVPDTSSWKFDVKVGQ